MKEKFKLKHHMFHLMEELKDEESIILFSTFVGGRGTDVKLINEITYISKNTVDSPICFLLMFEMIGTDMSNMMIPQSKLDEFKNKLNELKNGIENVEGHICVRDGDALKSFTIEEILKNKN